KRRSEAGAIDEIGGSRIAQDGVILVLAIDHQVLSTLTFRKITETITEIPAAWTLAEVTPDRAGITNLLAPNSLSRLGQGRIFLLDRGMVHQLLKGDQSTQTQASPWAVTNSLKFLDLLDIDNPLGG